MRLYIARHGLALHRNIDPQHSLSDVGIDQLKKVAGHLQKKQIQPLHIYHSGILRARQSAEIFNEFLKPEYGMFEISGLLPDSSIDIITMELRGRDHDIMLVSHLPFLNELCSDLVTGYPGFNLVNFYPGTVVALLRLDSRWIIEWVLNPEAL
jgi:phosphohistidine phosphatase